MRRSRTGIQSGIQDGCWGPKINGIWRNRRTGIRDGIQGAGIHLGFDGGLSCESLDGRLDRGAGERFDRGLFTGGWRPNDESLDGRLDGVRQFDKGLFDGGVAGGWGHRLRDLRINRKGIDEGILAEWFDSGFQGRLFNGGVTGDWGLHGWQDLGISLRRSTRTTTGSRTARGGSLNLAEDVVVGDFGGLVRRHGFCDGGGLNAGFTGGIGKGTEVHNQGIHISS
jgi:hypothetical protein